MAYWLVKDEPSNWSWQMHTAAGTAPWDGVRAYPAAKNLRAMKKGERAFFYHSVTEKQIVGVLEVAKEAYPDPIDETGKWVCVDFKALHAVPRPVTLEAIKKTPKLKNLALIRQSRLSVMPVSAEEWAILSKMAGLER
jgi:predicted RNA-binding protein with PUA-like domain